VLTTLTRVVAPLLPMISEEIHRNLTGDASVHLTDWPDAAQLPADPDLVRDMDRVRDVCTATLFLREERGLRTRLPLRELTVAGRDSERLAPFVELIADEVNVKTVSSLTTSPPTPSSCSAPTGGCSVRSSAATPRR
jgi:isoleucyl-tRNA synthetase